MAVDALVTYVSQVRCFREGEQLALASGFFYMHKDRLYLITNRHVVVKEDKNYCPDELRLKLHTSRQDACQNADYSVSLYGDNGRRAWKEHPSEGEGVDVVAIPLDTEQMITRFVVRSFKEADHVPDDVEIAIGEDVLVIGYPLGFHDTLHNLPIVRSATIASVYPVPFDGEPVVLIDARLHKGTSGSPVITKPSNTMRHKGGGTLEFPGIVRYLVGVHSAEFDIVRRNPKADEPLGLNAVWFAALIPEVISEGT